MILSKMLDAALLNKTPDVNIILSKLDAWHRLNVNGVCIPSSYVHIDPVRVKLEAMIWDDIEVIPVIGYPNGDVSTAAKIAEIIDNYSFATTLDIVLNATFMRVNMWELVRREIIEILLTATCDVRWIIETPVLSANEITEVCGIILDHRGQIKSATGTKGNTEIADIKLIKSIVSDKRIIKASGGINTPQIAQQMIDAGANIIGTSNPEGLLSINI